MELSRTRGTCRCFWKFEYKLGNHLTKFTDTHTHLAPISVDRQPAVNKIENKTLPNNKAAFAFG
jgi:hypothetical protein